MSTTGSVEYPEDALDQLCINTIRFLSIDAVQKADSGHPGLPMGAAAMAYVLWTHFLKHNPADPAWFDRDRFVLSAGHGSMLLYSLLHLTGYAVPLEQIQQFRQWGSITPGHPERGLTPGVETSTGPLGQGFANGVGMAIVEAFLAARYNRPGSTLIDHFTYGIVSDGDLMEGVASEAASLAGHMRLGKIIYLYDNNHVTLSAATSLTFSEDVQKRFDAYGWHTQSLEDGNDLGAVHTAIENARAEKNRPSLILARTHLGYGSPHKQDTFEAHGSPLGQDEVKFTKEKMGWPLEPAFYIPEQALHHFRRALIQGKQAQEKWDHVFSTYSQANPALAGELEQVMRGELPDSWEKGIPQFTGDAQPIATRTALRRIITESGKNLPTLIGGSADLDPSTYSAQVGLGDFESPEAAAPDRQGSAGGNWGYAGKNIHFGVREHAMGGILNGMAVHGGVLPYGATFLVFSDYMRPPIRLAALMKAHVLYIFTHDSIGLGEDGPTHQPVEQLLGLRSIPGMVVIRPADANETAAAWRVAIEHQDGPVALVLSRQKLPVLDPVIYPQISLGVSSGGYILSHPPTGTKANISLVATGSEVHLALAAQKRLAGEGVTAQVISLPSWNLFEKQPVQYRETVFPTDLPWMAIEAGVSLGWRTYLESDHSVIGIDHFGASAPGEVVMRENGFELEHVCQRVHALLQQNAASPVLGQLHS